ncbi:flagella basal body P-ring formation protein FlgA [Desulfomicrobium apsheronum]|uniref:Flagella basal body P-ring formation protein FlgA n=1 Tax=Desulfomicrobium apsheronum TaxID=52560 RepID=A0A1I3U525_9BACT|nr:flagellar basal body P-ring formation chaperone FlgA [Desulfomicrobium apsheronum]SFJ78005.1 flagella basal body P-ring formation protein FlgA [Desulfomicrobium apsheronum]
MRLFVALFVLLLCPCLAVAQGRLIVAGAVCVDGPAITLNDLAQAEGEDAKTLLAAIGTVPLLASPKFDGARANLNGSRLRELIVQRFGTALPPVDVPDQVQVQRGGQVLSTLALRPAIDKILTNALAHHGGEVEIREHRMADYLFLSEKGPVQVRVVPVGTPAPGRISLRLEAVTEDGRPVQSFTGTVFADVWKTVPCAARVLNRGDILEPGLVGFARKNLAYMARAPWDGGNLPLRMTAAVGEGQVISADAVEFIPVVAKGQILTLVYAGQTLKLTVPVESLEDGGIGNTIRVRNMQSRRVVAAQVVDAETVRVP